MTLKFNLGNPTAEIFLHPTFDGHKFESGMNRGFLFRSVPMRRRVLAWMLFLTSVLLLSLAATPYCRTADAALRLTLLIVLSILVVRERWRNRHEPPGKPL